MTDEQSWEIMQVKMWEYGHSLTEIRAMNLEDVSMVVGVLAGKARGEARLQKLRKNLGN